MARDMSEYADDRRMFHAMRVAGWRYEPTNGGFSKQVTNGAMKRRLWVSWGQAADALRLADVGETVQGVAPVSEHIAGVVAAVENDDVPSVSKTAARSAVVTHVLREVVRE